jgi:hypothetical protein
MAEFIIFIFWFILGFVPSFFVTLYVTKKVTVKTLTEILFGSILVGPIMAFSTIIKVNPDTESVIFKLPDNE